MTNINYFKKYNYKEIDNKTKSRKIIRRSQIICPFLDVLEGFLSELAATGLVKVLGEADLDTTDFDDLIFRLDLLLLLEAADSADDTTDLGEIRFLPFFLLGSVSSSDDSEELSSDFGT